MGLTDGLKRAQKVKGTHTVPFKRKQYLYPQPLMHIRLSIFCYKKKNRARRIYRVSLLYNSFTPGTRFSLAEISRVLSRSQ